MNELLWSLGITTYNVVYARIGTEALAAVNIAASIDNMAFVIFMGIGNACAILVGNQIGAGRGEGGLSLRRALALPGDRVSHRAWGV